MKGGGIFWYSETMTEPSTHTTEQALRAYIDAYRLSELQFPDVLEKCTITVEDHQIKIEHKPFRNGWDDNLKEDFKKLEASLNKLGFQFVDLDLTPPPAPEKKRLIDRVLGPEPESKVAKPHLLRIDASDLGFAAALAKLEQETIPLKAKHRAKEAEEEQKQVANAIETLTHHMPKHPTTAVAAATIDGVQRMTHTLIEEHLIEADQVKDTLVYGTHTQDFVAQKLATKAAGPDAPTWIKN